MSSDKNTKTKAHCNRCQIDTNHRVCFVFPKLFSDEYGFWKNDYYEILECCGCEEVKFRKSEECSEWNDFEEDSSGEWVSINPVKFTYFPSAMWRSVPKWSEKLAEEHELLHRVHEEVYTALQANSLFLASSGTRALIDLIITDTVGDVGSFKSKLERLSKEGWIAKADIDAIEAALEAGHASTHRGWIPTQDQLTTVMNIIENLIERVYILAKSAKALRSDIPKRS